MKLNLQDEHGFTAPLGWWAGATLLIALCLYILAHCLKEVCQ